MIQRSTYLKWIMGSGFCMALIMSSFGVTVWMLAHHPSLQNHHSVKIIVSPGLSADELAKQLHNQGLGLPASLISLYIKLFDDFKQAKSGTYELTPQDSLVTIMHKITSGQSLKQLMLKITIPEGFTLKQIVERLIHHKSHLADGSSLTSSQILHRIHQPSFIRSLNLPERVSTLEGYLYPETYEFYDQKPTSDKVIRQMARQLQNLITPQIIRGLSRHQISLHDGIIMASLIEKETALKDEKSQVAEVIWNRLNQKMPLGIDAALIYGIDNYQGDITNAHLNDRSNPYNTRIHKGLPPTPIGSATISSLLAVINPSKSGYLYYVLIPHSGGRHHFSQTYRQHQRYVSKLVRATTR